jgi:group II intron reverse transcriptase/maturase
MEIRERLATLERLNADPAFENCQLYRMLYSEELYVIAYDNLRSNKGVMTAGISAKEGTADGINMNAIRGIIESLKDSSYQPKPARRVYIPKSNGKMRPLGMPDFKEKLVQECVRIILNCIYDSRINPTFQPTSFGFRKGLGCHHALKRGYETLNYSAWIIKADVKAFFDEVNHSVLIGLLRKRIKDERFINLIWKQLRCGYTEKGQVHQGVKGTPQGGNVSPILANIYLHEFDLFIEGLKTSMDTKTIANPAHKKCGRALEIAKLKVIKLKTEAKGETYKAQIAALKVQVGSLDKTMRSLPSMKMEDPEKASIAYVRYADDWILGLKGSKAVAEEIYNQCETFFRETLHLNWNKEKSILSRSTDQDFEFLGVDMHFVNTKQVKVTKEISELGRAYKRRTVPVNHLCYRINADNIFARLKQKGYVDENNEPISYTKLINQDIITIARIYLSTMNGIGNYYRFVHNSQQLNYIHFVLFMSLCKTLAHKGKTTKRQIMKKYLKDGALIFRYGINQEKVVIVPKHGRYNRDVRAFNVKTVTDDRDPIPQGYISDTAAWLKIGICGLCGKEGYTEMHHVKHIKRQGEKYKGFDLLMQNINRKQVPLCRKCHTDVHNGVHDGISVQEAAQQFYKHLGFKKWQDREERVVNSIDKKTS